MHKIAIAIIFLTTFSTFTLAETPTDPHSAQWTGFYAGLSLGAIINQSRLKSDHSYYIDPPYNASLESTDVLPGIHAGYNHELSNGLVFGGEADFTYPDSTSKFISVGQSGFQYDKFSVKNTLQGAVHGRIGYDLANFLPYITAGISFADTLLRYENEASEITQKGSIQVGWILGAGLEYALCRNLSVRSEYLYTDFGNPLSMGVNNVINVFDPNGFANADLVSHSVRAAINYRF